MQLFSNVNYDDADHFAHLRMDVMWKTCSLCLMFHTFWYWIWIVFSVHISAALQVYKKRSILSVGTCLFWVYQRTSAILCNNEMLKQVWAGDSPYCDLLNALLHTSWSTKSLSLLSVHGTCRFCSNFIQYTHKCSVVSQNVTPVLAWYYITYYKVPGFIYHSMTYWRLYGIHYTWHRHAQHKRIHVDMHKHAAHLPTLPLRWRKFLAVKTTVLEKASYWKAVASLHSTPQLQYQEKWKRVPWNPCFCGTEGSGVKRLWVCERNVFVQRERLTQRGNEEQDPPI